MVYPPAVLKKSLKIELYDIDLSSYVPIQKFNNSTYISLFILIYPNIAMGR